MVMAGNQGLNQGTKAVSGKVTIQYAIEVDGQVVYSEAYDPDDIDKEMTLDANLVSDSWIRRIKRVLCCRKKAGFIPCLARCLLDGKCCDEGHKNCQPV
jgi:hypothetical protein